MSQQTYLSEPLDFLKSATELEAEAENLFRMILEKISSAINGCRIAIFLEDSETGLYCIKGHVGISPGFAQSYRKESNWTIGKVLWEETASIFDGDCPGCKQYEHLKLEHDFASTICAPIFCDGFVVGYIHCEHPQIRFVEEDLRFVSRMAAMCSGSDHVWRHLVEVEMV